MRFSLACVFAVAALSSFNFDSASNVLVAGNAIPSQGVIPEVLTSEATKVGTFSESDLKAIEEGKEVFTFQAEVNRLMDIVINSLYKNKEIFLRELISNASDALDKVRFLAIKDPTMMNTNKDLQVKISFDKEARTITISDTGIGMTRTELIENLGTVAKSGTTNFMEALGGQDSGAGGDLSMIGQFGVGFYSIYLVADKVTVASKNNADETQHIWSSTADGNFIVSKDPRGNTLGRGTEITMYLKDDAGEFLDDNKLESLVKRYSEFITFPILLRKEVNTIVDDAEEANVEGEDEEDEVEGEEEEGDEDEEDEEEEAAEPKSSNKKGKKKEIWKHEWVKTNNQVAIWSRPAEEVTDEEYKSFYTNLAKDGTHSDSWIHFKAEGEVDFRGILYIPSSQDHGFYDKYYEKEAKIRLYVRKVLISDEFKDLVPQYLNFLRGVVDSDDLPLNVNRESLQQSKILKVMGKKLVRKALEMLRKMATEEEEFVVDEDKKNEKGEVMKSPYANFWDAFGKSIKLGVIEDSSNRSKLVKLLRFKTSSTEEDKLKSLDQYVANMKEWQNNIYYIAGASVDELKKSPFLEKMKKKGLEVLFLVDPVDEYVIQHVPEFEGKRMMSITKEGLKFGDEDENVVKKRESLYKKKFAPLTDYLQTLYDKKISKVKVSQRIEETPSVLVTGQYGNSANMERIMKAQTFQDNNKNSFMNSQKTMEINPRHPLVTKMLELVESKALFDKQDTLDDMGWMLYDTAALNSGFTIEEVDAFTARLQRVMKSALGVESFDLEDEIEIPEDEEEEEKKDEVDLDADNFAGMGESEL